MSPTEDKNELPGLARSQDVLICAVTTVLFATSDEGNTDCGNHTGCEAERKGFQDGL